jgi:glycine oxidase
VAAVGDVLVVGGGAVGAACARELAQAGRRVVMLEQGGDVGQAWRAAAGMLAPQIEAGPDDPLLPLGLAGRDLYPMLAEALVEATGVDVGLWREGIAWAAADEIEAERLQAHCAWQRRHGLSSEWLDADEVRSRVPWLGPVCGAVWAPKDGALDPVRLVSALRRDAQRLGAELLYDSVTAVERRGDCVTGVIGREGRYSAADVILAGGAWSAHVDGVPRPLAVAPVRGQMAAFPWPDRARRAIVFGHGCYLLARGDEAIAGSTMEYVGFRSEPTPDGIGRITAAAGALCPPLRGGEPTRTWAGLRPVSADGLPILGAEPRLRGLWYATGHGRNGILLAAITGVLMRQLLTGDATALPLDAYAPSRFWSWEHGGA